MANTDSAVSCLLCSWVCAPRMIGPANTFNGQTLRPVEFEMLRDAALGTYRLHLELEHGVQVLASQPMTLANH